VTQRVYKDAFTEEQAEEIIYKESAQHFDPKIVEIFFQHKQALQMLGLDCFKEKTDTFQRFVR
jgi:response regulator RpfG family c-di-GMP phosphodiesterase